MSNNTHPTHVVFAVCIYLGALMPGILRAVLLLEPDEELPGVGFVILMLAFPLAFWCRQNWARILYLAFFLLGGAAMLLVREQLMQQGASAISTLALQTIVQVGSIAFLFTRPADAWFRRQAA